MISDGDRSFNLRDKIAEIKEQDTQDLALLEKLMLELDILKVLGLRYWNYSPFFPPLKSCFSWEIGTQGEVVLIAQASSFTSRISGLTPTRYNES